MGTGEFTAGGNPASGLASHPGGRVEILLVASYYGNGDKLQPDGPLGSNADFFHSLWLCRSYIVLPCLHVYLHGLKSKRDLLQSIFDYKSMTFSTFLGKET